MVFSFHKTARELQTCTFQGPGASTRNFGPHPHPFLGLSPTLLGLHSGPYPSSGPHPAPHPIHHPVLQPDSADRGLNRFDRGEKRMLDFGQFDFGQLAEIEIGRSRNWPKSNKRCFLFLLHLHTSSSNQTLNHSNPKHLDPKPF